MNSQRTTKEIEAIYPLTFMQEGMLYHSVYNSDSDLYFEQYACRICGSFNIDAFKSAWQELINRHAILRTSFVWKNTEQMMQVVVRSAAIQFTQQDWTDDSENERDEKLINFLNDDRKAGFKLNIAPLMRITLIRFGEDEYQFVWSHHHLIMDAWSRSILLKELFQFYEAFCHSEYPRLEVPRPFRDYVLWLRKKDNNAESFWKAYLKGFTDPTPVPFELKKSAETSKYSEETALLSSGMTNRLNTFARSNNITLNTLVQCAWSILLSRYNESDDVIFGVTTAGRPPEFENIESMIGLFINTIPVRVQFRRNESVREFMKRIQSESMEVRDYEYSSLVQVQGCSELPRGVSLFNSLLVYENIPIDRKMMEQAGSLKITEIRTSSKTNYPVILVVLPGNELSVGIDYDISKYNSESIRNVLDHLLSLLKTVLKDPDQMVCYLQLLCENESTDVNKDRQLPGEKKVDLLHKMFERQVDKYPDNPAVICDGEVITYSKLNEESNRLANYLISRGVLPETYAGLYINRSVEMIIGILGILKAGAAYVPISISYPKERVNYILQDAGVKLLFTKEEFTSDISIERDNIICFDKDKDVISSCSNQNPLVNVLPENAAYVIYTSGSTGKPKGVVISNLGTCNLFENARKDWGINSGSRVLQFASVGFDASVLEIFLALSSGAALYIAPQQTVTSPEKMVEFIRNNKITYSIITPAFLTMLPDEDLSCFRTVVSGGETCSWELADKWRMNHDFFNAYGPTEITIACSWYRYEDDSNKQVSSTCPIGKPIPNVRYYILDRYFNQVPAGVAGEVYISGPGLARCYLNYPDLTAEMFIPNLFSETPGERLYRTGDIARFLSDGNVEYLRRNDKQVKIRGLRIELSEIESVLVKYKDTQNAAVLVKKRSSGDPYLAAYLVLSNRDGEEIPEIRRYLSRILPDYMIPTEWNFLDALPLTPNRKIDRKALLLFTSPNEEMEENNKPLNHIEELLKVIWAEVLELQSVETGADFFELGGHSLKATKVLSRIRKVTGANLSLSEFFNNPTISALAKLIQRDGKAGTTSNLVEKIEKSAKRNSEIKQFELSFAQQRLWFLEQMAPEDSMFNIPIALKLNGNVNVEILNLSLTEIVKRHESLRTVFISVEGEPFQVIKDTETLTLDYTDLSSMGKNEAEQEMLRIATVEVQKKFILSDEVLFRSKLVKISEREHVLILVMHHIISDGWSLTIFIKEMVQLYKAYTNNQKPLLPELTIQYADFAEWQRKWFTGEVFNKQLEYWKNELEGIKPLLEMPADFSRPAMQTFNGAAEKFSFSKETENKIRSICLKESVTQYTLLLSVFQILLARLSNSNDIIVGSPVANRTNYETEQLIGFFVNTLAMRYTFQGTPALRDVLKNNREKILRAFINQDVPFEKLVEKLQPERNLSYSPIFQVAFVYQNYASSGYELPDVSVCPVEIETTRTKYDITLTISEETDGGLIAYWEYNTDLFKKKTALRMIEHFNNLLENLLENPEKCVWEVPIISRKEYDCVIKEWNSNKNSIPYDCCINQVFEKAAARHYEQIAVTFTDIVDSAVLSSGITYRELNERANKLAHYLRRKGLKVEANVAISIPRSINMIVAILAVLKAGGVFIPLDSSYPKERLSYMLTDSKTDFLITTEQFAEQFQEFDKFIIEIDKEKELIEKESIENPENVALPHSLAYIIYTSGSTGFPKGAMLSHKGLCNLSVSQQKFDINQNSRILQFASPSFDAFIWEFVMALLNGAKLDLISQNLVSSVDDISKIIYETGTTIVTLPPSILARLPEKDENERKLLASLNTIIVAGEKCPAGLANYWSERVNLINAYGPTETTVCVSMQYCTGKYSLGVPIGRPIFNCELYVLDKHMNPVPVGIPGELYIGGVGLSRGYINKPELTAEKFLPNPFSSVKGSRLYKSGDLVKYNENGELEFLGRIDSQVKIHGLRIELGEIEAVLNGHTDVLQAAVKVESNNSMDTRLIGYITPKNGAAVSGDALRRFLRNKLPEYMIPSLFITLPEFPLTRSGKIDYKSLPSADLAKSELEKKYAAPANEIESKLVEIGKQLLKIDNMGVHDSFFELGGHSLLVTRFISKIRDEFNVEVPLRTIFESPTVSELAEIIKGKFHGGMDEKEKLEKIFRGSESIEDLIREIENLPDNEVQRLLKNDG